MTLGILPTQHGIGERSMPERSQILVGKSGCWRLAVVLVTAVLYSATAPTAQTQPIRTFPASVVFQKDSFDCGPAALATLLQLRLRRPATLPELTQTVPELSRPQARRLSCTREESLPVVWVAQPLSPCRDAPPAPVPLCP